MTTLRVIAAEFVATAIVMMAGPGLVVLARGETDRLELALGYGLATALAIGVLGAVGNPMLSLALWFAKAITGRELGLDVIGQLLGAVFGGAVLFALNDAERFAGGVNGYDPGDLGEGVDLGFNLSGFSDLGVVLGAELVFCVIVVVVLLAAVKEQASNAVVAAFTGGSVALAALFLHDISGVGINPARSIGTAIFADTDPNALGQVWVFVLVPVVAAFAGLLVWLAIDESTVDDTVFDDTVIDPGD
jgi:aquaporin Z